MINSHFRATLVRSHLEPAIYVESRDTADKNAPKDGRRPKDGDSPPDPVHNTGRLDTGPKSTSSFNGE